MESYVYLWMWYIDVNGITLSNKVQYREVDVVIALQSGSLEPFDQKDFPSAKYLFIKSCLNVRQRNT